MEDLIRIGRDYLECVNKRDWDGVRALLHSGYTYTGGDGLVREGPEVAIAVSQGFISAMSDAHISVDRAISTGRTVVLECTGTGTHDGPFAGASPTGRRVKIPVCIVLEFEDGKVLAEREYLDIAAMLRQMGALPP